MGERISAEYVRELLDRLQRLEKRVEQLEGQLADRDRRIAELEQQLEEARTRRDGSSPAAMPGCGR